MASEVADPPGAASLDDASAGGLREAPQPPASARRGLIGTLVSVIVSVAAVGWVAWTVDFRAALSEIATQSIPLVVLAIVIAAIQLLLGGIRWHIVRRGLGIEAAFRDTMEIYSIGSFMSSYVITGLSGDFMRGWLSFSNGIDLSRSVQSVVIDRVLILLSVAVILTLMSPWFLLKFGAGLAGWLPTLMSVGFGVAVLVVSQVHRLPERWLTSGPAKMVRSMSSAMHAVFVRPSIAVRGIAAGIVSQGFNALLLYTLAVSLRIPIGFLDALAVSQIVAVTGALPLSVGGWGVRELTVVGVLSLVGVDPAKALLLSVQYGLCGLLVNLPGGVVWMLLKRRAPAMAGARKAAGS